MIDLARVQRVMAIFAHPDDETLAAGGTLHKLAGLGAEVRVIIPAEPRQREIYTHCENALRELGYKRPASFGSFRDNEMDSASLLCVIQWMQPHFDVFRPDLVLTHHFGCTNIDHRICNEAVTVLTRPLDGLHVPVLCGEVPSSTGYRRPCGFEPNFYVELSLDDVNAKARAMMCYESEARFGPHPRSGMNLRALAAVRGSEAGFFGAEAFMLLRGFA